MLKEGKKNKTTFAKSKLSLIATHEIIYTQFPHTYPKVSKLHQIVGDLDKSSDIHPVLEGRDENTRHKKRSKDDLVVKKSIE